MHCRGSKLAVEISQNYYYNHLMALLSYVRDHPGELAPER